MIQELGLSGEFEGESDDNIEGYLDEEVAGNSSDETPLEEESCMEIGGEVEQLQGIGDAAHIPIYTRQPGMRADIGKGRSINFFTLSLFQQPYVHVLQHNSASTKIFATSTEEP